MQHHSDPLKKVLLLGGPTASDPQEVVMSEVQEQEQPSANVSLHDQLGSQAVMNMDLSI